MSRTRHRKGSSENEETNNNALLIVAAIIVVICITLLFGSFIYWTIYSEPASSTPSDEKNVCQTPDCIRLAHQMNNFGNKSVDPCVDFYGYTCGRYSEQVASENMFERKNTILRTLITEYWHKNRNVSTDSKSETIMKQLFELCSSTKNPENKAHHNEALHRDLLTDINKVGSWPMIDPNFNETKFNVSQYLKNMAGKLNMIKTLITEYWHKNRNVSTDSKSETIMKQLFELCSSIKNPENKANQNEALHRDLLADINKVGSWPMIDPNFNGTKFNVSQYLENMAGKLNMIKFGLFKFDFSRYFGIVYDKEAYILSNKTKQEILQLVKNLIIKSKVQVDPKTIETDMKDVDELRQKLQELEHEEMAQFRTFDDFLSENRPLINFEKNDKTLHTSKASTSLGEDPEMHLCKSTRFRLQ
uniref:Peptidase_M13_N domain-containing protein n=1 Tax=Caenorhabditis japonica TaxID=281687 RepID=A0A8R1HUZ0_CAEJA